MGRDLRFYGWAALAYFVVLETLLAAAILLWPDFEGHIDDIKDMIPLDSVKGMLDQIGEGGVAAYVYGQHFFKGCNTVGTLAAVVMGMGAVAGEASRGTLEIWLARPISRRRLLLERWALGALATVVPVFATTLTVPWLLARVHEEMPLEHLMLGAAHQSLLLLAFYAATFLWSCLVSRTIPIAFGMLLLMVFEFALYLIKVVTRWSLFRLTDIDVFLRIGAAEHLDWKLSAPLAAVTAAFLALSLLAFARRVP